MRYQELEHLGANEPNEKTVQSTNAAEVFDKAI